MTTNEYIATAGTAVGGAVVLLLGKLLAGRTFKQLLLWPLEAWANRSKSEKAEVIVEDVKKDWNMEDSK